MGDGSLSQLAGDVNEFANAVKGMGGTTIGSNSSIENTITQGLTSAIGPATAINPIAGAAVAIAAGVSKIVSEFFKGANPNQVYSAETEQIYEAAADNIMALVNAGYFDKSTGLTIVNTLISQGTTAMQQLQNKIGNLGGMQNMLTTLNNEAIGIQSLPDIPLLSFTFAQAQSLYIQPNTANWYSNSIAQATILTNQLVNLYITQTSGGQYKEGTPTGNLINAILSGNITAVESIIMANPIMTLIIIVIIWFMFKGGKT